MPRTVKRRRRPPFVRLDHSLVDSTAFNDLRPASVMVLISILRRHNGMNGDRKDPIVCPYSAMKGTMAPATIAKAIRDLEAHGFINRVQQGGLYKQPNTYELTQEWRAWKPPEKNRSQLQKLNLSTSETEAVRLVA